MVDATLNGVVTTDSPPSVSVHVYGPGDIVGIDPNVVIRTEPRPYTSNFEPNYLAGIEFGSHHGGDVFQAGTGIGHERTVRLSDDTRRLVLVVLVGDLADDLLQHVLDGHQAGDAAVFVRHQRHVVMALAEVAQSLREPRKTGDRRNFRGN